MKRKLFFTKLHKLSFDNESSPAKRSAYFTVWVTLLVCQHTVLYLSINTCVYLFLLQFTWFCIPSSLLHIAIPDQFPLWKLSPVKIAAVYHKIFIISYAKRRICKCSVAYLCGYWHIWHECFWSIHCVMPNQPFYCRNTTVFDAILCQKLFLGAEQRTQTRNYPGSIIYLSSIIRTEIFFSRFYARAFACFVLIIRTTLARLFDVSHFCHSRNLIAVAVKYGFTSLNIIHTVLCCRKTPKSFICFEWHCICDRLVKITKPVFLQQYKNLAKTSEPLKFCVLVRKFLTGFSLDLNVQALKYTMKCYSSPIYRMLSFSKA